MYITQDRIDSATDEEIIEQLRLVGATPPIKSPRGFYTAHATDSNQLRWLLPKEVGFTTSRDPRLMKRLRDVAAKGIVERRFEPARFRDKLE